MKKTILISRIFVLSLFVLSCSLLSAQTIVVSDDISFYDTGGEFDNYSANEDYTVTYTPLNAGDKVSVYFEFFYSENGYDNLYIYDGLTTDAPLIVSLEGEVIGDAYMATNEDGALTFRFYSDGSQQYDGWIASVSSAPFLVQYAADQTSSSSLPFLVNFSSQVVGADNPQWSWDFDGDGVEDADVQDTSFSYEAYGNYTVSLTVSDGDQVITETKQDYVLVQSHYTLKDDDVVMVDGVLQSCSYDFGIKKIIIPDTLDGQTIINIGDDYGNLFYNKGILSVSLPSTLEVIGYRAFYGNTITELYVPASVSSIGERAFYNCSIDTLVFEEGSQLQEIGNSAFYSNSLSTLIIPNSLTSIGSQAFMNNAIDTLIFEEGSQLKSIGNNAFAEHNLSQVVLPNSIVTIEANAFDPGWNNTNGFSYFILPSPVETNFGGWLDADGNTFLAQDTVRNMYTAYFAKLPYTLTDDDVVVTEDGTLESCTYSFESKFIIIPNILDGQAVKHIDGGGWNGVFQSKGILEVTLPSTLESVGDREFYSNQNLASLTIPAGLLTIGEQSFYNCGLDTLIFEEGSQLRKMGSNAFSNHHLSLVTLPNSVVTIGSGAFSPAWNNTNGFTYFILPAPTDEGFKGWISDDYTRYNPGDSIVNFNTSYAAMIPYTLTDEDVEVSDGLLQSCSYDYESKLIVIPDTLDGQAITAINSYVFRSKNMVELTLPSTVKTIGNNAFSNNRIAEITIPSSVEYIGASAFSACGIDTLIFEGESQLKIIADNAFDENYLSELLLPNSVVSIGTRAFASAWDNPHGFSYFILPSPTEANFEGWLDADRNLLMAADTAHNLFLSYSAKLPYTLTDADVVVSDEGTLESCSYDFESKFIIIPDTLDGQAVKHIDDGQYWNGVFKNKSLLELTLPSILEMVGDNEFTSNSLALLTLPAGLLTIGEYSFQSCNIDTIILAEECQLMEVRNNAFFNNSLSTIIIPNSLTSIGSQAFIDNAIDTLIFEEGSQLKWIGDYAFANHNLSQVTLPNSVVRIEANAFSTGWNNTKGFSYFVLPTPTETNFEGWLDTDRNLLMPEDTAHNLASSYFAKLPYTLTDDDVVVTEEGVMTSCSYDFESKFIIIPDTLDGQAVKRIDDGQSWAGVFYNKELLEVTLPSTLASIGDREFYSNQNLASLTIPASLHTIGEQSFYNCSIDTLIFEEKSQLMELGYRTFSNNSLSTLIIPNSLMKIGSYAFSNNATGILIFEEGSQLKSIGEYAFSEHHLSEVTLPNSVLTIEQRAFEPAWNNTNGFSYFTLPSPVEADFEAWVDADGNKFLAEDTVRNMYLTYYAKLPYTLTDADVVVDGAGTLQSCSYNFENKFIIIPDSLDDQAVKRIDGGGSWNGIFQNKGLLEVTLPSALIAIGDHEFSNNILLSLSIPAGVRMIGSESFYNCRMDTLIFAEEGQLEEIGFGAFSNNSLSTLVIPSSVKRIENQAFGDNETDTLIFEAGSQLKFIGNNAFANNNLSQVTLPNSVVMVETSAFAPSWNNTKGFSYFILPTPTEPNFEMWLDGDKNEWMPEDTVRNLYTAYFAKLPYTLTDADVVVNAEGTLQSCSYNFESKFITIPDTLDGRAVQRIDGGDNNWNGIFQDKGILEIALPATLEGIGEREFYNNSFASVTIPSGLQTLGEECFYNCGINTLIFEEGSQLEEIGNNAFNNNSISTLVIPSSVKKIGSYAFRNNEADTLIFETGSQLRFIGDNAFANHNLSQVTLPNSVVRIETSAFDPGWNNTKAFSYFILPSPAEANFEGWFDGDRNEWLPEDTVRNLYTAYSAKVPYTLTDADVVVNNDGTLVSCSYDFESPFIIIPDVLDGQTVRRIDDGDDWKGIFQNKGLLEITLPSTLEAIGSYEFSNNYLGFLTIPQQVAMIDYMAFNSSSIDSLIFEDGSQLETISQEAFSNNQIRTLALPQGLKVINSSAFSQSDLVDLSFDAGSQLRFIGNNAFQNHALTELTLPTSLISIGSRAFESYRSNLELILPLPNYESYEYWYDDNDSLFIAGDTISIHYYNYRAFVPYTLQDDDVEVIGGSIVSCSFDFSFTDIIIPEVLDGQEVFQIGANVFASKGISTLQLPATLRRIQNNAFESNNLKSVDLENCTALTYIGQSAFYNNSFNILRLPEVVYDDFVGWKDNFSNRYQGGELAAFSFSTAFSARFPYVLTNADVEVVDGFIRNAKWSFPSDVLVMPDYLDAQQVMGISNNVFAGRNISSIVLPDGIYHIGNEAFNGCQLDSIVLPSQLLYLGFDAFANNYFSEMVLPSLTAEGYTDWVQKGYNGEYATGVDTVSYFSPAYIARLETYTLRAEDVVINNGIIESFEPHVQTKELIIPENIGGNTILGVGADVFADAMLTAISFPVTLQSIGRYAFGNNAFTSLVFPSSLGFIGASAFYGNNSLAAITFGANPMLSSIGTGAFLQCAMDSITLPATAIVGFTAWQGGNGDLYAAESYVTDLYQAYIAQSSYYYELTDDDVVVYDGVIVSCSYSFENKNIKIPAVLDGQVVIGIASEYYTGVIKGVFASQGLTGLLLPAGMESIGDMAFVENTLTSLDIPSSVKYIGFGAFAMNSIDTIIIPKNVEELGSQCFVSNPIDTVVLADNSHLYSIKNRAFGDVPIVLPTNTDAGFDSWESMSLSFAPGDLAFTDEPLWARITHTLTADEVTTVGGILVDVDYHPRYNILTLPAELGITSIDDKSSGQGVFENHHLREMNLPAGLTSIGYYAFRSNMLDSVILPQGLLSIGNYAFANNSLDSIALPDGLMSIGQRAFDENELVAFALPDVFAPNFLGWQNDIGIYYVGDYVSPYNSYTARFPYTLTDADVVVTNNSIVSCNYGFTQKDIIIPDVLDGQQVYGIAADYNGSGIFGNKGLASVQLPTTLINIGDKAFKGNANLWSITIPVNVEQIGSSAFEQCGLRQLTFDGNNVLHTIGNAAFSQNYNLYALEVPESVESIAYQAFYNCNISNLSFSANSKLVDIGVSAFYRNNLDTLIIPARVVSIGDHAFRYCNISSLGFEASSRLTSVGKYAFADNNVLTSVSLPDSVREIKDRAFASTNIIGFELPLLSNWLDGYGNAYNGGYLVNDLYTSYISDVLVNVDTIYTDSTIFYDTGGAGGDYSDSENYTVRYAPATPGTSLQVVFEFFDTESTYDKLLVYDGLSTNDPLLADMSGNDDGRSLYATNPDGALTFVFMSDVSYVKTGWKALISSATITADFYAPETRSDQVPFEVNFTSVVYGVTSPVWSWDFDGDGTEDSNVPNPTFTYTQEGVYTVSLTVSDGDETVTVTKEYFIVIASPYTLTDEDVEVVDGEMVSCSYAFLSKDITIPDVLDNQVITSIAYGVFYGKGLTSIVLPAGLQSIANSAFDSNGLDFVTLPSNLMFMGSGAFANNPLSYLVLPAPDRGDGSVFLQWDDDWGESYNGGNVVNDFWRSYSAIFNSYSITISVVANGEALQGANVTIGDTVLITDVDGRVRLAGLQYLHTNYNYSVHKEGYTSRYGSIYLRGDVAIEVALVPIYDIVITVTDGENPIPNVVLFAEGYRYTTDENGVFRYQNLEVGVYEYATEASGFAVTSGSFAIVDQDEVLEIQLRPLAVPVYNVSFNVKDLNDNALNNAILTLDGETYASNYNGQIQLMNRTSGSYPYSVVKPGYIGVTDTLLIEGADVAVQVRMPKILTTVYSATLQVRDDNYSRVKGAEVLVNSLRYTTNINGEVLIPNLVNGVTSYTISKKDHYIYDGTFTISGGDIYEDVTITQVVKPWYQVMLQVSHLDNPLDSVIVVLNGQTRLTDSFGNVIFSLQEADYAYRVVKEGFEEFTGELSVVDDDLSMEVALVALPDPVYRLNFYVTDGTNPVFNATISIGGVNHTTDGAGEVSIINLADGLYFYTVQSQGFNDVSASVRINGANVDEVVRVSEIVTPTYAVNFLFNINNVSVVFDGTTYEANGNNVSIYNVVSGTYAYTCNAAGYEEVAAQVSVLNVDVNRNITMQERTTPSYSLSINVLVGGNALAGASVSIADKTYITGSSGQAVFDNLEAGTYTYSVVGQGYIAVSDDVVITDKAVSEDVIMVAIVNPVYTLTVKVKDGTQNVPGATVSVGTEQVLTNMLGEALFYNLVADTYIYSISAQGYLDTTNTVAVTVDTTVIVGLVERVIPVYNMKLTVTNGNNPIAGAVVVLGDNVETLTSDANGVVEFTNLEAATYVVSISAAGYEFIVNKNISVEHNVNQVLNMTLTTYDVSFTLRDGNVPIADATVTLGTFASTVSDASGVASFSGLLPADIAYSVLADGYDVFTGNLTVIDHNVMETVQLALSTFDVTFTITDGTTTIAGASVNFGAYGSVIADVNGAVTFTSVVPAIDIAYTVTANGFDTESGTITVVNADVNKGVVLLPVTGLQDTESISVAVYPNPAQDIITIAGDRLYMLQLYDISGNLLISYEMQEIKAQIDLSALDRGVYLLQLMHNDKATVKRIMIE